jgi:hypothetical protein
VPQVNWNAAAAALLANGNIMAALPHSSMLTGAGAPSLLSFAPNAYMDASLLCNTSTAVNTGLPTLTLSQLYSTASMPVTASTTAGRFTSPAASALASYPWLTNVHMSQLLQPHIAATGATAAGSSVSH